MHRNFAAYRSNFSVGLLLGSPSHVTIVGTQHHIAPEDGGDDIGVALPRLGVISQPEAAEENTFYVSNPTPTPTESQTSSASPFTPTPIHSDRALIPKRKRESAKTGRWQKDEQLWKYSRNRLPHEEERDDHGQKLFYCEFCAWSNISSNAAGHLRMHGILVGRAIVQPAEPLQNQSIEQGLQNF